MKWSVPTNFCNPYYLKQIQRALKEWFVVRNIKYDKVLLNLKKNFLAQNKNCFAVLIQYCTEQDWSYFKLICITVKTFSFPIVGIVIGKWGQRVFYFLSNCLSDPFRRKIYLVYSLMALILHWIFTLLLYELFSIYKCIDIIVENRCM